MNAMHFKQYEIFIVSRLLHLSFILIFLNYFYHSLKRNNEKIMIIRTLLMLKKIMIVGTLLMLKKIMLVGTLLMLSNFIIYNNVLANPTTNLKTRLDRITSFHVYFIQKITDSSGCVIQKGQGSLWVKRPNLFNWHITKPSESILISDGTTVWFYNPSVEQVNVTWLKDVIETTPFMLIAGNEIKNWKEYGITQIGDYFELTPKNNNSSIKKISIDINNNGTINKICFVEQDGQQNNYQFKYQKNNQIDLSKFAFDPPKGVKIDDQRN